MASAVPGPSDDETEKRAGGKGSDEVWVCGCVRTRGALVRVKGEGGTPLARARLPGRERFPSSR